jgi:hypothetical protein
MPTTATTDALVGKVEAVLTKAHDLELHVMTFTDGTFGEVCLLREFCPSSGRYGKVMWMPVDKDFITDLVRALKQVARG